MTQRLPPQPGEWIDRSRTIEFVFEGKTYPAFVGDTVSSALWAMGERVLGRSFKYHRPRGILSHANQDVNVMLEDGTRTNLRGDVLPVEAGMVLKAVNRLGSVERDFYAVLDWLSPFLPVGFYYKTFHRPKALFPFWEGVIRRMAGLGALSPHAPRSETTKRHAYCDVLVVGAGPAGLSAALTASQGGARVILVDENPRIGGTLSYDHGGEKHALDTLRALQARIANEANIRVCVNTTALGYYADHLVPLACPNGLEKVRASKVIIASGAFEQPAVFRNNDLPGVMLGSAAQRLIHRYAVKPCERAVVLAGHDLARRVTLDLIAAGVEIAAYVELRETADCRWAEQRGIPVYRGYCVYEAYGKKSVEGVEVCLWDGQGRADVTRKHRIACDGVVMSVGWAPAAALLYQSGCQMRFDETRQQFLPARLAEGIYAAGRVNGNFGLEAALADGERAARNALGLAIGSDRVDDAGYSHPWPIIDHPRGKNFIDFDEDLQLEDFANAIQESFDNIELLKRFTTVGMGPSQGKHSNMNAIRVLSRIRNQPIAEVGTTTSRPFFHPVPLGLLAGRSFDPERLTPLHAWHLAHEATWVSLGGWQRPAFYGSDRASAIVDEVMAVRTAAGLIDLSTLGKFEIRGPQAGLFLERFYTGHYQNQAIGSTRYAMLLDETGVMVDDGIVARLAEDFYYVTASTSNAAAVYREMTRCQQIWGLDATIINLTGSYGALNLAGPLAPQILAALLSKHRLERLNGAEQLEIAGVVCRLLHVRFVSEIAYEIHAPARAMLALWEAIHSEGAPHGLKPFGIEAQRVLRLEMGHFIIGHDTDGLTHPFEVGLDWALAHDKPDYLGYRSLRILKRKPLKKRLVGFTLTQPPDVLPDECCLVLRDGAIVGRVTSIAHSPTLNRTIGLAYVAAEDAVPGATFVIRHQHGMDILATVVPRPFVGEAR
ncbi:MAG: 2Fe-2S iron-sulfur cluster-binding protein [Methylophilaceae bacterium]|nr:2Fe-2S iron-sulfur cluster-binding protein [Methylophilaceae bacterium]